MVERWDSRRFSALICCLIDLRSDSVPITCLQGGGWKAVTGGMRADSELALQEGLLRGKGDVSGNLVLFLVGVSGIECRGESGADWRLCMLGVAVE